MAASQARRAQRSPGRRWAPMLAGELSCSSQESGTGRSYEARCTQGLKDVVSPSDRHIHLRPVSFGPEHRKREDNTSEKMLHCEPVTMSSSLLVYQNEGPISALQLQQGFWDRVQTSAKRGSAQTGFNAVLPSQRLAEPQNFNAAVFPFRLQQPIQQPSAVSKLTEHRALYLRWL